MNILYVMLQFNEVFKNNLFELQVTKYREK
jgi:hypothetical protein